MARVFDEEDDSDAAKITKKKPTTERSVGLKPNAFGAHIQF